jgi:Zinc finger, C3HC4 type (RING finger)/Domain of unknown function (DUF4476)
MMKSAFDFFKFYNRCVCVLLLVKTDTEQAAMAFSNTKMDTLINTIKTSTFDPGKIKLLAATISEGDIKTAQDIADILHCFDHDPAKNDALDCILDSCMCDIWRLDKKSIISKVSPCFDFDPGQSQAVDSIIKAFKQRPVDYGKPTPAAQTPPDNYGIQFLSEVLNTISDLVEKPGRPSTPVIQTPSAPPATQIRESTPIEQICFKLLSVKDQKGNDDVDSNSLCTICQENYRSVSILNCNHLSTCARCLIDIGVKHLKILCPICQQECKDVAAVYLS